jgi:hypothetical protein
VINFLLDKTEYARVVTSSEAIVMIKITLKCVDAKSLALETTITWRDGKLKWLIQRPGLAL